MIWSWAWMNGTVAKQFSHKTNIPKCSPMHC
jgi:hypothetical protein